jgi:hypothetical protein
MSARVTRLVLSVALAAVTCGCDADRSFLTSPTTMPAPIVPLPIPPQPVSISVGELVRASITRGDPVCDPVHWDANAPCKVYSLVAPTSGLLTVTLTTDIPGSNPDVIDMMVTEVSSGMTLYSPGGAVQRLSLDVQAARRYEIRINSYPYLLPLPGALDFELRTELQP